MKSFILTSDSDHLMTNEHLKILRLFAENGIFITTAVFATLDHEDSWLGNHCSPTDTHGLNNSELKLGLIEAQAMGHEIAFHGTSQCSNTRDEFLAGIDKFKKAFGDYPFTYIEHGPNPLTHKNHSKNECKLELLSNQGSDQDSPYYIKDIVSDVFNVCWTHEYLLYPNEIPNDSAGWLKYKDEINYISRARMGDFSEFKKDTKKLNHADTSFVGYTHFGYQGYFGPKRKLLLNMFRTRFSKRFEYWNGKNITRNIHELRMFLNVNNFQSKTVKDFVLSCQK